MVNWPPRAGICRLTVGFLGWRSESEEVISPTPPSAVSSQQTSGERRPRGLATPPYVAEIASKDAEYPFGDSRGHHRNRPDRQRVRTWVTRVTPTRTIPPVGRERAVVDAVPVSDGCGQGGG